jgi:hypothetical protein
MKKRAIICNRSLLVTYGEAAENQDAETPFLIQSATFSYIVSLIEHNYHYFFNL